ncbi:hypothetical protein AXX12_02640 [Anaerosporomusa subterranea]|uniref:Uncharacterized protein n=1 Tax=Anaerosporomusa subterranea TaxID=1794912 RepID=A0A154BT52_ANASB|nr:hypothetical protein [Anaerosporomusa subterranea]KYZ77055.1 hypothetical protein AXX12_02640 [Anaerosporomusa subterranea]
MLSLFFEYPIVTGISFVLALILASVVGDVDSKLGEILGMNMVFPIVVFCFMAVLEAIFFVVKAFQTGEVKKRKNRARAFKARNSKD